jgi:8-oxo-dGTP diphosphatase
VEFGERLADALRIEIAVGELLDVADHLLPAEGQHWVSPSCICRVVSGTPSSRELDKCSAIAWFVPDEIPAELTEVTRVNLANYLKHRSSSVSA